MAGQKACTRQSFLADGAASLQKHGRGKIRPLGRFFLLRKRIARHSRPGGPLIPMSASAFIGAKPVKSSSMKALRKIKASAGALSAYKKAIKDSCAKGPSLVSLAVILAMNSIRMKLGKRNLPEPSSFKAAKMFFTAAVSHESGCSKKWQAFRMYPT